MKRGHRPKWDIMKSREYKKEEILYRQLGNDSSIEEDSDSEATWEDKELQDWLVVLAVRECDDPKDGTGYLVNY